MSNLEFIYNRKSVRQFKEDAIPKEDLLKLIEAAMQAPSPKHQQNLHYVVLQDKEVINKMAEIVRARHEELGEIAKTEKDKKIHMSVINYYTSFKNAPVVVIVYARPYKMIEHKILSENNAPQEILDVLISPQSGAQEVGAAVENMLLAATAMGYGSCYMTGPTHAKTEIENLIGFENPGYELMAMVSLGVPADETPAKPKRRALDEMVTFID